MTVTGCTVVYGQEVTFEQAVDILKNLFEEEELIEAIKKEGYYESFEDEGMDL
uniref:Uncharacterized protein n=1 Tax=Marseillevirus LCMAC102 TaxID=2506603 RepID=A0A481YTD0_9VIRU|nr:MAG: hypothetical protein LCMAC102_02470 [Marseillevirus LCMAC102]